MKQLRQGRAFEVGGVTITPIEQLVIDGDSLGCGITVSVDYTPLGIIIDNGNERWALGIDGEQIDPNTFK